MKLKAGTLEKDEDLKGRVKTLVMAYLVGSLFVDGAFQPLSCSQEHGGPPPTDDEAEDPEQEDQEDDAQSGSEPVPTTSTKRKKPRSSTTTNKGPSRAGKKGKTPARSAVRISGPS